MTITHINNVLEKMDKEMKDTLYSPYQATKYINKYFSINLPPQMLYNYSKKGYIDIVEKENRRFISKASLIKWAKKYSYKNLLDFQ